jgi:teichuronic acid biosynthesis glycosyltransferase TuaG
MLLKISVIIPTYNRSALLLRAIESVLNQTYFIHEILVCDDGSTDDSYNLIQNCMNHKIKWIECGRNGMPSVPRNIGIRNSTGDWIAFLDSDDIWHRTKIEEQVNCILKNNCFIVSTNAKVINGILNNEIFLKINRKKNTFLNLLIKNEIVCSSVLINKNVLTGTSLFPEDLKYKAIEDYALWIGLSYTYDFYYIEEALVYYNDDPEISIRTNSEKNYFNQKKLILNHLDNFLLFNKVTINNHYNVLIRIYKIYFFCKKYIYQLFHT